MHISLKSLLLETAESGKPKTLFKNDWLSLMSKKCPDGDEYVYSHETRCDGNIIAVLLYRRIGKDGWEYGVREERTPCWGDKASLSSLTGGVNPGESPAKSAVREIKEESGYDCKESDLEPLGTCRGTKSCDTVYHLYALDVADLTPGKLTGDDVGKIKWLCGTKSVKAVDCPIFYAMYARLGFY